MCGIAGFLSDKPFSDAALERSQLKAMCAAIAHRGPDSWDAWSATESGIALGHLRLAILDLSQEGSQPMASSCGRFVVVYNGEIYNHLSIRSSLEDSGDAPIWRGHSDTETLLAAVSCWGLEETLRRIRGMFALAIWDKQSERLILARDRMGEKPLYYGKIGQRWVFGSELHALRQSPDFKADLDPTAVASYLRVGYVPEGQCIYRGLHKVPPGCTVTMKSKDVEGIVTPYETFLDIAKAARMNRFDGWDPVQSRQTIETTLSEVIDEQMLSDVPLGCFLSGGVDSSLIASLMQAQRDRPIQTFAIGFDIPRFNEAPRAAEVAKHLGTDHTEFILSARDALDVVPDLPFIYDEPFSDSSQIPTILLCRQARKSVTVALSGDGGDEIFGGYNRHVIGPKILRNIQRFPKSLRRVSAFALQRLERFTTCDDAVLHKLGRRFGLPVTAIDKLARLAPALASADDISDLYAYFTATFPDPGAVLAAVPSRTAIGPPFMDDLSDSDWMMAMDSVNYLPGDILVKVDRAAMSTSLETRAPFLDARVVAAAWRLQPEMRAHRGRGKSVLRDILARHVPKSITERPKQGFAIPLDSWLRTDLKEWASELLSREPLLDQAGFNREHVKSLWKQHLNLKANNGQKLWALLMLLGWLDGANRGVGKKI